MACRRFMSLLVRALALLLVKPCHAPGQREAPDASPGDTPIRTRKVVPSTASLRSPVMELNRFNFHANLNRTDPGAASDLVVMFCPGWYDPCQDFSAAFAQLCSQWERRANNHTTFGPNLRFASVSCDVDKPLCSQQGARAYPWVVHYRDRKKVSHWRVHPSKAGQNEFRMWLHEELRDLVGEPQHDGRAVDAEDAAAGAGDGRWDLAVLLALILLTAHGAIKNPDLIDWRMQSEPRATASAASAAADAGTRRRSRSVVEPANSAIVL